MINDKCSNQEGTWSDAPRRFFPTVPAWRNILQPPEGTKIDQNMEFPHLTWIT